MPRQNDPAAAPPQIQYHCCYVSGRSLLCFSNLAVGGGRDKNESKSGLANPLIARFGNISERNSQFVNCFCITFGEFTYFRHLSAFSIILTKFCEGLLEKYYICTTLDVRNVLLQHNQFSKHCPPKATTQRFRHRPCPLSSARRPSSRGGSRGRWPPRPPAPRRRCSWT